MQNHTITPEKKDSNVLHNIFLQSAEALETFFSDWTSGRLPKAAWTHAAHVAMAAYIAFEHAPEEAFERMKAGILHHNDAVGTANTETSGYHETLTRLWCAILGKFVCHGNFASRLEAVREAVRVFGEDRERYKLYYGFDVVNDRRARREWVRPDRQHLENATVLGS